MPLRFPSRLGQIPKTYHLNSAKDFVTLLRIVATISVLA